MKNILSFFLCLCFIACKKDAGKHCPMMVLERDARHLADLSPVNHLTQIMDTLNKYPELQATKATFNWGYDPGSYSAKVQCNIYYKDLIIFNSSYTIISNSYGLPLSTPFTPLDLTLSTQPGITAERANQLAEETMHFDYCKTTRLGLLNVGMTTQPDYRLIWRVRGTESGYPLIDVDAQNGDIYNSDNGIRY